MSKRVIILNFDIESKSYQAFSAIKKLHATRRIKGEQMAVVTHVNDGNHKFQIEDFIDFTGSNKSNKGGMIGMLIGILGGWLGVMLGWFAGGMIGATQDAKEIRNAQSVFEFLADKIREEETGVILIANEDDNRPLNDLIMYQLGGEINRLDYEEVEEQIKEAQDFEKKTKEKVQQEWEKDHSSVSSHDHQSEDESTHDDQ